MLPTALTFAVLPVVLSDVFAAEVRYTGISLAYQLGAIVGGGLAPLIATALLAATGTSSSIGLYMAGANLVMLVAAFGVKRAGRAASGGKESSSRQQTAGTTADGDLLQRLLVVPGTSADRIPLSASGFRDHGVLDRAQAVNLD